MYFSMGVKRQQYPQPGRTKTLLGLQLLSATISHLEWVWTPGMFYVKHLPWPHLFPRAPPPPCPTLLPPGAAAPGLEERRETAGEGGGRQPPASRGLGRQPQQGCL